jgi:hypothetical protein
LKMDRFKVDGDQLRLFYSAETQLQKVFSDIERDLQAEGKVVCQFVLNGLSLSESDESRFSKTLLQEVVTLEYLCENQNSLVETVISGWISALPEMIKATENFAMTLRENGMSGKLRDFHKLIENTEYLIGSVTTLKSMNEPVVLKYATSWVQAENSSLQTVRQALEAVNHKEIGLLADILEYDLNNSLQLWYSSLTAVQKGLQLERDQRNSTSDAAGTGAICGRNLGLRKAH